MEVGVVETQLCISNVSKLLNQIIDFEAHLIKLEEEHFNALEKSRNCR